MAGPSAPRTTGRYTMWLQRLLQGQQHLGKQPRGVTSINTAMGRYVPALTGTAADSLRLASIQGSEAVSYVP
jgi:hypothetical protein